MPVGPAGSNGVILAIQSRRAAFPTELSCFRFVSANHGEFRPDFEIV
jgi:hypothetical protein